MIMAYQLASSQVTLPCFEKYNAYAAWPSPNDVSIPFMYLISNLCYNVNPYWESVSFCCLKVKFRSTTSNKENFFR